MNVSKQNSKSKTRKKGSRYAEKVRLGLVPYKYGAMYKRIRDTEDGEFAEHLRRRAGIDRQ